MKNKKKTFLALCLTIFMLCGCQKSTRPLCRFVTQVDISCDHGNIPIRRHYTSTEKMEAVLLYLRLLRPGSAPLVDPDKEDADIYQITVSLSDGEQHIYRQKDHRYFRIENYGWQSISPERASRLYELLRHLQSDT